ncbi:MAG: hypothetical protein PVJ13_12105, partial [Desulfobacterales bacterium]
CRSMAWQRLLRCFGPSNELQSAGQGNATVRINVIGSSDIGEDTFIAYGSSLGTMVFKKIGPGIVLGG